MARLPRAQLAPHLLRSQVSDEAQERPRAVENRRAARSAAPAAGENTAQALMQQATELQRMADTFAREAFAAARDEASTASAPKAPAPKPPAPQSRTMQSFAPSATYPTEPARRAPAGVAAASRAAQPPAPLPSRNPAASLPDGMTLQAQVDQDRRQRPMRPTTSDPLPAENRGPRPPAGPTPVRADEFAAAPPAPAPVDFDDPTMAPPQNLPRRTPPVDTAVGQQGDDPISAPAPVPDVDFDDPTQVPRRAPPPLPQSRPAPPVSTRLPSAVPSAPGEPKPRVNSPLPGRAPTAPGEPGAHMPVPQAGQQSNTRLPQQQTDQNPRQFGDLSRALIRAGAGMLASDSPFFGQALGQGALAAIDGYERDEQRDYDRARQEWRDALDERVADAGIRQTDEGLGIRRDELTQRGDIAQERLQLRRDIADIQLADSAADRASREKIAADRIAALMQRSAEDNKVKLDAAAINAASRIYATEIAAGAKAPPKATNVDGEKLSGALDFQLGIVRGEDGAITDESAQIDAKTYRETFGIALALASTGKMNLEQAALVAAGMTPRQEGAHSPSWFGGESYPIYGGTPAAPPAGSAAAADLPDPDGIRQFVQQ